MRKRDFLKQLNNLKNEVKPDAAWKQLNRDILLSQIKAQTSDTVQNKINWSSLFFKRLTVSLYKPVAGFILVFGIVLGSYVMTVGATKNSLPGDFLYPIKITSERMKINLANNDEKKANLEIAFAERRLEELQKITDQPVNDDKQKENVQVSLQKFQESINNMKTSLAKLEKTDSNVAVKVAKLVDEKTKNYVEILTQQKDKNPDLKKTEATLEAITSSKAMAEKALDMIINEYKAGSKEVTLDTVIQSLEKKMADLNYRLGRDNEDLDKIIVNKKIADDLAKAKAAEEAKAKAEAEKAAAAAAATAIETGTETPAATTEVKPAETPVEALVETIENINLNPPTDVTPIEVKAPEVVLPSPAEIKVKLADAQKLLLESKGYLITKEVLWSYSKLKDANDIIELAEDVIEANKEYLEAPKPQAAETPAPATIPEPANVNTVPEKK
ncbi:MAG: DUF5667 domain-containing protein [Candidatus Parcubacteria bacterium]|nr:DUF5667 domain-containing protein [Candidatus Parcubacteria bacterium]